MEILYETCDNKLCDAKVKIGVAYCCLPCQVADEGKYEIHDHSDWCKDRQAERKDARLWPQI